MRCAAKVCGQWVVTDTLLRQSSEVCFFVLFFVLIVRFAPAPDRAEDAGGGGDFDDLSWNERRDREVPCGGGREMRDVGEPSGAEDEGGKAGLFAGDDSIGEAGAGGADGAGEETCAGRCERIGEEVACGGAEQLGYSAGAVGGEDGQARGAFGEVEEHRGEPGGGAEQHADEDDGEGLEGERYERERERQREVRAERDQSGGGYGEGQADREGVVERL